MKRLHNSDTQKSGEKPYGALAEAVTKLGKVQGHFRASVVGQENIQYIRKIAQQEKEFETTICNRLLNVFITELRIKNPSM